MASGDWDVGPQNVIAPPFAGPNDPAIEFGSDPIPPELIAYYGGLGQTVISVIQFRRRANNYEYIALLDDGINSVLAAGSYKTAGGVAQAWSITASGDGVGQFNVGGPFGGTLRLFPASGSGDFLIASPNLVSQARGWATRISSAAGTAAIGAGETVVLTTPAMTWKAARAYEAIESTDWSGDTASNLAFTIIRRNNVGGAVMGTHEFNNSVNVGFGQTGYARTIIRNNTGADIVDNIVQTVQTAGGGNVVGAGGGIYMFVRYLEVRDVGAASDYPNATQI